MILRISSNWKQGTTTLVVDTVTKVQDGRTSANTFTWQPTVTSYESTYRVDAVGRIVRAKIPWLGSKQRPMEQEAGLRRIIEMGARMYDPTLQRFLQVDPVESGTSNDYLYVNDPINDFDLKRHVVELAEEVGPKAGQKPDCPACSDRRCL